MEETYLLNYPGVRKKIVAGGSGPLPHFAPGTKLVFHFKTLLDDFERTVIDDSRQAARPAEIFVGKLFKMEVWEPLLTSMRVGEVAEFWCDATHTGLYPIVSKGMRLIAQGRDPLEGQRHMCGMGNMFHYHSTGFPELDELMRTPQPLIFIMELLQVGDPMSYHRESWMMEKDEKLQTVPILHMQGNTMVKLGKFRAAADKYKEAVLLLKTVQSREMPGDIDYINLGRMIVPLELNYCQCMLELEEFYQVIEHTTELLDKHKDCVKGYYKRAKAHAAVWNEKEARRDFNMVSHLDMTLSSLVHRELKALSERMKEKYWEEKEQYWNMLETKESKNNQDEQEEDEEKEKEEEDKGKQEGGGSDAPVEGKSSAADPGESSSSPEEKDWQQMLRLVMHLQKEGNFLIQEKKFQEAGHKFKEALGYVDILQNKVDRRGDDWESLEKVRLPLSLNFSQSLLELQEFQQVVELNNKLLKKHKGNFKALYQRAHAHAALCNGDEARRDFEMVKNLDPKFAPYVKQEMKKLGERVRSSCQNENKNYWDTMQEKWGPDGTNTKGAAKKKNVKFAPRAMEGNSQVKDKKEEEESEREETEKPAPAEASAGNHEDGEKRPDEKEERAPESEEGLDKESPESAEERQLGQGAADNGAADKDSDPVATGTDQDNVVSSRSACDNGQKKVQCQSSAVVDPSGTSAGNKASDDKTGNAGAQSQSQEAANKETLEEREQ